LESQEYTLQIKCNIWNRAFINSWILFILSHNNNYSQYSYIIT
jgi:hypothetical protein